MILDTSLPSEKLEVLEGIIVPTSWNKKGRPNAYALLTFDEGEYGIDAGCIHKVRVRAYLKKRVRLTCRLVKKGRRRPRTIFINEIKAFDERKV
jgi:hypothetical protein